MENEISSPASPTPLWVTPSPDCARRASDRIPKWLLRVIRQNLATGGELTRSAVVVASGSLRIAAHRAPAHRGRQARARRPIDPGDPGVLTHQPLGPGIGVPAALHGCCSE